MKQTFLHIADLHYRANWPEENDLVFASFIDDLTRQVKQFDNLWLIFSGDLVQAGGGEQAYEAFVRRLDPALTALGIPPDRRICVPGNHDVSQPELKPLLVMQKGTLAEVRDEEAFNREFSQLSASIFE